MSISWQKKGTKSGTSITRDRLEKRRENILRSWRKRLDIRVGNMVKFFNGPPWFEMQVQTILEGDGLLPMIIVTRGSYWCACAPIALRKVKTVVNNSSR